MTVLTAPTIRHINLSDLPMLLAAQEASANELDSMEPMMVAAALSNGQFSGLVLEAEDRRMCVTWQRDGQSAMLTTLYREGTPKGFMGDCKRLWERVQDHLREFDVKHVCCVVGLKNPKFTGLTKLYGRLGFRCDLVRMGRELR